MSRNIIFNTFTFCRYFWTAAILLLIYRYRGFSPCYRNQRHVRERKLEQDLYSPRAELQQNLHSHCDVTSRRTRRYDNFFLPFSFLPSFSDSTYGIIRLRSFALYSWRCVHSCRETEDGGRRRKRGARRQKVCGGVCFSCLCSRIRAGLVRRNSPEKEKEAIPREGKGKDVAVLWVSKLILPAHPIAKQRDQSGADAIGGFHFLSRSLDSQLYLVCLVVCSEFYSKHRCCGALTNTWKDGRQKRGAKSGSIIWRFSRQADITPLFDESSLPLNLIYCLFFCGEQSLWSS
jgi:hypothetical protein